MTTQEQDEDEIIILSDENDFSTWLEIDEKNEKWNTEAIESDDNIVELSLDDEVKEDEAKDDEEKEVSPMVKKGKLELKNKDIIEEKQELKSTIDIPENNLEPIVKGKDVDAWWFSFDLSWWDNKDGLDVLDSDTVVKSTPVKEKKTSYSLNSIIDWTIYDLKIRRDELDLEKTYNSSEEDFRNIEINRLRWEISSLKIDKSKLEVEIKKIDENIASLGKMKIPIHPSKVIKK